MARVGDASTNLDNVSSGSLDISGIGHSSGDLLLLLVSIDGTAGINTPAGFTQVDTTRTNGTSASQIFQKISDGTETSISINVASGSERAWIGCAAYSGRDQNNPIESFSYNSGNSEASASFTALTPGEDNCDVVGFIGTDRGSNGSPFAGGWAGGALAERLDNTNGPPGNARSSAAGAYGDVSQTTAAQISGNVTFNFGDTTPWHAWLIALREVTGSEFFQSISANMTGGVAHSIQAGKIVTSAVAGSVLLGHRAVALAVTPFLTASVTVTKAIADILLTAAFSAAGHVRRRALKPLGAGLVSSSGVSRRPGKTVPGPVAAAAGLAERAVAFSVSSIVPVTITAAKAIADILVAADFGAVGRVTRSALKPLASGLLAEASTARQPGKIVAAPVLTVVAFADRAVSFGVSAVTALAAAPVKAVTWTLPAFGFTASGVVVRSMSKPLTAGVSAISGVTRRASKAVSGVISAGVTAVRGVAFAVRNGSAASAALQKAVNAIRIGAAPLSVALQFANAVAFSPAVAVSASTIPEAIRKAVRSAVAHITGAFRGGALLRGAAGLPAVSGAKRSGAGLSANATDARARTKSSGKTRIE